MVQVAFAVSDVAKVPVPAGTWCADGLGNV